MIRQFLSLVALALCCQTTWAGVSVAFVEPSSTNIVLVAPATFTVRTEANIWEDGERITSHKVFRDGVQIASGGSVVGGSSTATTTVSGLGPGSYAFTASATNNWSATAYAGITVTVNAAPSVQLGSVTGSPYIAPATLGFSATASDSDGSINRVEFYANGSHVGSDSTAPYQLSWSNVSAGTYSITAKAFDNHGTATTSAATSVTVSSSKVIGQIDGIGTDAAGVPIVWGWACSTGLNQSIGIHTYVGGGWPSGVMVDARTAALASEPGVASACQASGNAYRFNVPLSNALRDQHGGKPIYIHGISPVGQPNDLIGNSGTFVVPVLTRIATFVAQSVPTTVLAGTSFATSVQMRNDGSAVWRASDGFVLGSSSPLDNTTWGLSRAGFAGNVGTGGVANIQFTAKAPATPGTYNFQWQMLQEGVVWFPSPTANVAIRVINGSISASPNPCAFPSGGSSCAAAITWSSTATDAEVWVTDANNANGQLFARAQGGTQTASNVTSSISRFHLKAAGVTIATVDVSGTVNPPPAIQLTAPTAGVVAAPPASFLLKATASDTDGIASVKFYGDGVLLNTDASAPYEFNWTGVGSGDHSVHAIATDNRGGSTTTPATAVLVNAIPTVQLTSPSAGNNGIAPATVAISANAADVDGGVTSVSFYVNGQLRNTDTVAPYAYTWSGVGAGNYNVHAVATDTRGATATSTTSAIAIVAPVVNPSSGTRYYIYDQHQRLCKVVEPETRATVMDYDAAGNLAWSAAGLELMGTAAGQCDRTDPSVAARRVSRTYDKRNHLETLSFPDGRGNQSWAYTADGLPRQITTYNGTGNTLPLVNSYTYNARRLLTGESQINDPANWSVGYGYDANGNRASLTYPGDGMTVTYAPNALGQPTQVASATRTYVSGVRYYPNGAIRQFTYGNGVVHSMTQNARQLPEHVASSGGVLDYTYAFDFNGNAAAIYDVARGASFDRTMTYDNLDRLKTATSCSFGGDCTHRYTYDKLDNLLSWRSAGGKDYAEYYYEPGTHRLISVRNSMGSAIVGLGYDVQGNLNNKNGQQYAFDIGNRLREAVNKTRYQYDGHGRRVRAESVIDGKRNYSLYGQDGTLLWERDEPRDKRIQHLYLAGTQIAQRSRSMTSETDTVTFQHTDALGSPVAVTDTAGAVIERTAYEPFGAVIGGPKQGVGYTGHVMDAATGLTYMQQRYYDPTLGRFLSVDPVTADGNTGGNFNRYWYANNNPYRFTDPDGRLGVPRMGDSCNLDWCRQSGGGRMSDFAMAGGRSGGSRGPRSSGRDVRTTTEARDLTQGVGLTNAIRRLDPNRPMPQFVGPADGPAYNRVTNEVLSRELVSARSDIANRIANNGHSFQKHVIGEGQFSGIANTPQQFARHVNNVLNNYTHSGTGARGQAIFYHSPSSTIVYVNHAGRYDAGTSFQTSIETFHRDAVGP